jgi:hypothetical protein
MGFPLRFAGLSVDRTERAVADHCEPTLAGGAGLVTALLRRRVLTTKGVDVGFRVADVVE